MKKYFESNKKEKEHRSSRKINKSMFILLVLPLIFSVLFILCSEYAEARVVYYDPVSNISTGWNDGTGLGFYQIDDGTRRPTAPNTADYVSSRASDGTVSEFGFSALNTSKRAIINMSLWVYTRTGSNAQYTFNLYQTGTSRCSNLTSPNTANSWRGCSWTAPSGSYTSMSVYLGTVTRNGGGALAYAYVYSAYLEVYEDLAPVVNISYPPNNALRNISYTGFNFTAVDDYYINITNCSLWGNFTGAWTRNTTIYNVTNNTQRNISISLTDGLYMWNVECTDARGSTGTNYENRTVRIDLTPPNVTLISPENNTDNKTSNIIVLSYNVSDVGNVSNCSLYINSIYNDSVSNPEKGVTLNFTKYFSNGNYTWRVSCIDEANNSRNSVLYYFNVSVYNPEIIYVNCNQNIMLNPGTYKGVRCNISAYHPSGVALLDRLNSTFKFYTSGVYDADHPARHYTNNTCEIIGSSSTVNNYSCEYYVQYYANNGTWHCNVSIEDTDGKTGFNSTTTTIQPLYAINVSDFIDYGDVAAAQYSSEIPFEIKNAGNMNINVSVKGYGGDNPISGDGYSFLCENRNVTVDHERYSLVSSPYVAKSILSSVYADLGFTITKQQEPATEMTNTTYWQIYAPPGDLAYCNGTISFLATSPN